MATEVICIVDTVAGHNPDYTSLQAALDGESGGSPKCVTGRDFVTNDEWLHIICRGVEDSGVDSDTPFITDEGHRLVIEVDQAYRHRGRLDVDRYHNLHLATGGYQAAINLKQDYTVLIGMQAVAYYTGAGSYGFNVSRSTGGNTAGVDDLVIYDSCVVYVLGGTNQTKTAVLLPEQNGAIAVNCLILNTSAPNSTTSIGFASNTVTTECLAVFMNCTVSGCGHAFREVSASQTWLLINCLSVFSGAAAFTIGNLHEDSDYNATDRATATGGTYDRTSQTFSFVDIVNGNYQLQGDDAGALRRGTDLSQNEYYPFDNDLAGATRVGAWDIGASEYLGGGEVYEHMVTDGLTLGESITPNAILGVHVTDGLTLAENRSASLSIAITLSDEVVIGDITLGGRVLNIETADGVVTADMTHAAVILDTLAQDGVALGDGSVAQAILQAIGIDGILLGDAAGAQAILNALALDGASIGDTGYTGVILEVRIEDGVVVMDDCSPGADIYPLTVTDGIRIADTPHAGAYLFAAVTDGMTLSDVVAGMFTLDLSALDGLTLSDQAASQATYVVAVADGVSIGETVTTILETFVSVMVGVRLSDIAVSTVASLEGAAIITFTAAGRAYRFITTSKPYRFASTDKTHHFTTKGDLT